MNKAELFAKVDSTWLSAKRKQELKTAVEEYSSALIATKPFVSGSLPLHKCPVCGENAGKTYIAAKLPTVCQCCDHIWMRG